MEPVISGGGEDPISTGAASQVMARGRLASHGQSTLTDALASLACCPSSMPSSRPILSALKTQELVTMPRLPTSRLAGARAPAKTLCARALMGSQLLHPPWAIMQLWLGNCEPPSLQTPLYTIRKLEPDTTSEVGTVQERPLHCDYPHGSTDGQTSA